jgi:hypothetical protein
MRKKKDKTPPGGRRKPDTFKNRKMLSGPLLSEPLLSGPLLSGPLLSGPLLGLRASARQHGLGRGEVSPTIHQRGWVSMDSVPLGCHVAKCRCRPQDNQGRRIVNGLRRSPPALGREERKGDGPERDQQDDCYPSVTSSPACRLLFPSMLDVRPRISHPATLSTMSHHPPPASGLPPLLPFDVGCPDVRCSMFSRTSRSGHPLNDVAPPASGLRPPASGLPPLLPPRFFDKLLENLEHPV